MALVQETHAHTKRQRDVCERQSAKRGEKGVMGANMCAEETYR